MQDDEERPCGAFEEVRGTILDRTSPRAAEQTNFELDGRCPHADSSRARLGRLLRETRRGQ